MMKKLLENEEIFLSVQTIHRYMNVELGLKSVTRKRKKQYVPGAPPHKVFVDLLQRDFHADARNTKWCIDFTYLKLSDGRKRYNCSIIDLYDRRIVASVNGDRINAGLAKRTMDEALSRNGGEVGMILHSDRGSQFTSKAFIVFCEEKGIIQSMSRPGSPYDNAPIERYFNTLKAELIYLKIFEDEDSLYTEIKAYAYGWYNNLRPHSYNGGLPPAKVA